MTYPQIQSLIDSRWHGGPGQDVVDTATDAVIGSFTHAGHFVTGQVVGDDHIAGAQGGAEKLLHVGKEEGAIHRPVQD